MQGDHELSGSSRAAACDADVCVAALAAKGNHAYDINLRGHMYMHMLTEMMTLGARYVDIHAYDVAIGC